MRTPPTMEYYRIVVLMTDPQFTFQRLPPTLLVHVVFVGGEKRLYGVLICLIGQIGGLSRSPCKME